MEHYLNDDETHPISKELKILNQLAQRLKHDRYKDGRFYVEESAFGNLDYDNEISAFQSHSLIEEFMIFCNSLIADYLCDNYSHVPLRIQKMPEPSTLKDWYEKNIWLKDTSFGVERYLECIRECLSGENEPQVNNDNSHEACDRYKCFEANT